MRQMTEDERYIFDLNGYIIVRNVLTQDDIETANKAIDKHLHEAHERSSTALRNAKKDTNMYGTGPGRKDLGGILEWDEDSTVFKSILAHPKLLPLFHGLLGKGYRMDHMPLAILQDKGSEGFQLHGGTIDCSSGEYNYELEYNCNNGIIRNALLGCNVMLSDHNPGDGGFCIVPGSHKSNFKMPSGMVDGMKYQEFIQQTVTKAGDVILFSEGTVHGALPWMTESHQRRVALYRFAPATRCYGRAYLNNENSMWPEKMYDNLNDAQKSVLEPPYANRLDRPVVKDDCGGEVDIVSRSKEKKEHDKVVFGTKYF